MAQTKVIQRRIRSVRNAKQITKALEVVAASRMRRIIEAVEGSRRYGQTATDIINRIAASHEARQHPYFSRGGSSSHLYIIFTSDRGQAGAFNSNVFNLALNLFKEERASGGRPQVIAIGRKGARFFSRLEGLTLLGEYQNLADAPEANVFAPLLETIKTVMTSGEVGGVSLIYTEFISSLTQKVKHFELLPISLQPDTEQSDTTSTPIVAEFEPELSAVLDQAIRLYFEAKLLQAKIESATSEHAMRMVAMGNANRNASDLIDDLTLELNATRQAAITQEIAEITGGAEAIAK